MDPDTRLSNYIRQPVSNLEDIIDYRFTDPAIAWEALQAPGSLSVKKGEGYNGRKMPSWGNETLATVGDAALDLTPVSHMYELGDITIGQMSSVKQEWLNNTFFAKILRDNKIEDLVQKDPSGRGAALSERTAATCLEAGFGAVYLDCGRNREVLRRVMRHVGIWPRFTRQAARAGEVYAIEQD